MNFGNPRTTWKQKLRSTFCIHTRGELIDKWKNYPIAAGYDLIYREGYRHKCSKCDGEYWWTWSSILGWTRDPTSNDQRGVLVGHADY